MTLLPTLGVLLIAVILIGMGIALIRLYR